MSDFLVTGSAGFIGSALARKLVSDGHNVVSIDNLSTGFRKSIPKGVDFIEGDCQDESIIKKLNSYKFDAIFHIAGQSSGEISYEYPIYDLQSNTQSTLLLLEYALKTKCKKFIYASTMSVYGEQPDIPVVEEVSASPKSFYAVGKLASEYYLEIYSKYNIDIVALRLFNAYGPGQNMENLKQGMISIFLSQAISNKHILVKGSPERYRDFVFIDDIINSFTIFIGANKPGYQCYNVSTGVRTTVHDLVQKILAYLPYEVTIKYSDPTPGDQFGIYGDSSKIQKEMGWTHQTNLDDGLKKMIEWYQSTIL